jgi:hypothetical protein
LDICNFSNQRKAGKKDDPTSSEVVFILLKFTCTGILGTGAATLILYRYVPKIAGVYIFVEKI